MKIVLVGIIGINLYIYIIYGIYMLYGFNNIMYIRLKVFLKLSKHIHLICKERG